jgi:2-methylcitrate dehydratase PrpD
MAKPFHPGKSAFDGTLAAILAKEGFTCAPNLLEAKKGFVEVLGVDSSAETIGKNLGRPFQVMKNTFKPYAACLLTHPTIDGVIQLRDQYHLQPAGVAAIECEVARFCMDSAGQMEPTTGLAGKFSLPFCAALALAEGAAGEDLFTDRRVRDPRMIALRKKVKAKVVPALKDTEAKVTITTKEGRKYATFIDRPKGDPRNPPTDAELEAKFRMLAGFALGPSAIDSLADRLWNLEKLKDVREVIGLMKDAKGKA